MGQEPIKLEVSPTVSAFVIAEETITVLISPAGEGKSVGCIIAILAMMARLDRQIRVAVIRDTFENIRISIIPTFQQFFDKVLGIPWQQFLKIKDEGKELTLRMTPHYITVDCFGIDDPASLGRLQGTTAFDVIWINEPAPISAKKNAGVSEEVYNAAMLRCVRGTSQGRLIVDMNPADEDHWTYRRFLVDPDVHPDFPLIKKKVFQIPYGENTHLDDVQRQAAALAYQHDPDAYARYVKGEFAAVYIGEKVTGDFFKPDKHVAPQPLTPIKGWDSFAIFDGWGNPACLLGQIHPETGRLFFIDTLYLNVSDISTLLETKLAFALNSPRWKNVAKLWRAGGDFSLGQPDQSNRTVVSSQLIAGPRGFFKNSRFEKGPVTWESRKAAMFNALRGNDSKNNPLVCISPSNKVLIRGLKGGWHYPKDNQGNITSGRPVQNEEAHICAAFSDACAILLPQPGRNVQDLRKYRQLAAKNLQRAKTYATAGAQR